MSTCHVLAFSFKENKLRGFIFECRLYTYRIMISEMFAYFAADWTWIVTINEYHSWFEVIFTTASLRSASFAAAASRVSWKLSTSTATNKLSKSQFNHLLSENWRKQVRLQFLCSDLKHTKTSSVKVWQFKAVPSCSIYINVGTILFRPNHFTGLTSL